MPQYAKWVDEIRAGAERGSLDAAFLEGQFSNFRTAVDTISVEISASTAALLSTLDQKQVAQLKDKLASNLLEDRETYVDPPLEQQIDERAKRTADRLKPWIGALSPEQQAILQNWSREKGRQNELWIDSRARWQAAFANAIEARHEPEFPDRVAQLLQNRHEFWSDEYQQAFDDAQTGLAALLADLYTAADGAQRARLVARLSELRDQITSAKCPVS
jgi:Mor family transcriptional regulator